MLCYVRVELFNITYPPEMVGDGYWTAYCETIRPHRRTGEEQQVVLTDSDDEIETLKGKVTNEMGELGYTPLFETPREKHYDKDDKRNPRHYSTDERERSAQGGRRLAGLT